MLLPGVCTDLSSTLHRKREEEEEEEERKEGKKEGKERERERNAWYVIDVLTTRS